MIYAFVGTIWDNDGAGSIRGNGKTLSMVYFGYQGFKEEKQQVYANFKISFGKTLSINKMLELFKNDKLKDTVILLDEAQLYIPSTGVKKGVIEELVHTLAAQSRKRGIDIMISTQRYRSIHRAMRAQVDEILVPKKIHFDGTVCNRDRCNREHTIQIWKYPELYGDCLLILRPDVVGKLYDSNEIVMDRLIIEDSKKQRRWRPREDGERGEDELPLPPDYPTARAVRPILGKTDDEYQNIINGLTIRESIELLTMGGVSCDKELPETDD